MCIRDRAANEETVDLAAEFLVETGGVVAVDLAGAEAPFPTEDYKQLFARARERKIPFTIHAGEAAGPESVLCAIDVYKRQDWDCTIPESVGTDEAYLPVTVDSSQLKAINMAASGVSFVLHGPPGTGKSQTITAMVANALTKGKTVLFVAEKRAALEVVKKRLAALGIQDFCLELHSNKATKKAVLDQLKRGLEIGVWETRTVYDQKIQDIRRMREGLDAYVKALHAPRPVSYTHLVWWAAP